MNVVSEFQSPMDATSARSASNILLVEDDKDVRQLYMHVLAGSGYEVAEAEDGEAAWQELSGRHYDLVITDNNMPRLSGLDLVRRMRKAQMGTPVILASGTIPDGVQELQLAAVLKKPFLVPEFLKLVQDILLNE